MFARALSAWAGALTLCASAAADPTQPSSAPAPPDAPGPVPPAPGPVEPTQPSSAPAPPDAPLRADSGAPRGPRWTVNVDPLTAALGFAHVQIERALAPRWSVYAGPHLHVYSSLFAEEPEDFLGVGVEVGLRRFFRPTAPKGAWVEVRGVVARLSAEVDGAALVEAGGYASALVGYTWIVKQRLVLGAGAGFQFLDYEINGQGVQGPLPALHTTIGVAF